MNIYCMCRRNEPALHCLDSRHDAHINPSAVRVHALAVAIKLLAAMISDSYANRRNKFVMLQLAA